ncbi:MAG: hypothetical protein ACAI25_09340 [Planctomycetota bacterium]
MGDQAKVLAVALAAAVMGCNGAGDPTGRTVTPKATSASASAPTTVAAPTSNSVAPLPAVAGTDRFAYVGSVTVDSSVYAIDPGTGQLTLVGSDVAVTGANALAVDPGRNFLVGLFGNAPGTGALSSFRGDPLGGRSVQVAAQPLPATGVYASLFDFAAADRIVILDGNGAVSSHELVPQTGAVRLLGFVDTPRPASTFYSEVSLAVARGVVFTSWLDPNNGTPLGGGATYVGPDTPSSIFAARLDASGFLTAIGTTAVPKTARLVADPAKRFVYVCTLDGIAVGTPDSTTGTLAVGTPLAAVANASLVFHVSGRTAYAFTEDPTRPGRAVMTTLSVDATSGALSVNSRTPLDGGLNAFTIDGSGTFAWASLDVTPPGAPLGTLVSAIQSYAIGARGGLTPSGQPLVLQSNQIVRVLATRR